MDQKHILFIDGDKPVLVAIARILEGYRAESQQNLRRGDGIPALESRGVRFSSSFAEPEHVVVD